MDLYRIMLVDDEEEVRKSIIKKIDWESIGFVVVGDAENGEDALEKLDFLDPDVIMTDIRMPYMDGLTLAEKIHNRYPSKKIILFSGFDDFEYAKEAITLGVSEYILKPVNVEELTNILKNVKDKLDIEIEESRNIDKLRKNYINNIPLLKGQFLNSLIRSKIRPEDIAGRLIEYGIDISGAEYYVVSVVDIDYSNDHKIVSKDTIITDFSYKKEMISLSVLHILEEKIKEKFRSVGFNDFIRDNLIFISAFDSANDHIVYMDTLRDATKEIGKILDVYATIGVGNECESLNFVESSYTSAIDAIGYKRMLGFGEVIYINDVEPSISGILRFDEGIEEELLFSIKFGPDERINEVVDKIISEYDRDVHESQKQMYMLSVIMSVFKLMQQYGISLSYLNIFTSDYTMLIDKIKNINEFRELLIKVCVDVNSILQEKRDTTSKQLIIDAKNYINDNYTNTELSLEMICNYLHISTAYFSTLFKKETGQTYIAYLTDLRMNKAIELLNTTNYKTYMVAEMVGYQEQNYFSYVFKKKFGVSPSKYRTN